MERRITYYQNKSHATPQSPEYLVHLLLTKTISDFLPQDGNRGVAWKLPTEDDMVDTPRGRIMPPSNYVDVTNEGVRSVICATYTKPHPCLTRIS